MARRNPGGLPPKLEPRESITSASSHFVFQIGGNMLLIVAVWIALVGVLGITGTMGDGWQGRVVGALVLVAAFGLFRLGKRLAIENRVMRRRKN